MEPVVRFEERLKVKPQVKAASSRDPGASQAEALNYMKKVPERRRDSSLNPYASMSALEKLKLAQEVKPELPVELRLEVAKAPLKERPHVQEVAEVLEELLKATERGLSALPARLNRAPGQIFNEAKKKREEDRKQETGIKISKEDVRKKRDQ